MKRKRRIEITRYRARITVVQGDDAADYNGATPVAAESPAIDIPPQEPSSPPWQKFLRFSSQVWWKRRPP